LLVAAWMVGTVAAQPRPVTVATAGPVRAACVSGIGLSAAAVTGGSGVSGTVTLTAPAPPGGLSIRLASGHPTARVTEVVTAEAGQVSADFTISTAPVASMLAIPITAVAGSCSVSTPVTVHPPVLSGIALSAVASRGNASLTGMTSLSGPAPAGGVVVRLQSSDPVVAVPVEVTIPAGETWVSFAVRVGASISLNSVAITASYGRSVENALLSVAPGI
jgi:hypothetical protein